MRKRVPGARVALRLDDGAHALEDGREVEAVHDLCVCVWCVGGGVGGVGGWGWWWGGHEGGKPVEGGSMRQ